MNTIDTPLYMSTNDMTHLQDAEAEMVNANEVIATLRDAARAVLCGYFTRATIAAGTALDEAHKARVQRYAFTTESDMWKTAITVNQYKTAVSYAEESTATVIAVLTEYLERRAGAAAAPVTNAEGEKIRFIPTFSLKTTAINYVFLANFVAFVCPFFGNRGVLAARLESDGLGADALTYLAARCGNSIVLLSTAAFVGESDFDQTAAYKSEVADEAAAVIRGGPRYFPFDTPFKNLKVLRMSGIGLTDNGAQDIARYLRNKYVAVKHICLAHNRITHVGADHIASTLYEVGNMLQSLVTLDVSHNPLGRLGCVILARAVSYNTTLRTLDVRGAHVDAREAVATAREVETVMLVITATIHISDHYTLRSEWCGPDGFSDEIIARRLFVALVDSVTGDLTADPPKQYTCVREYVRAPIGWRGYFSRNGMTFETGTYKTAFLAAIDRELAVMALHNCSNLEDDDPIGLIPKTHPPKHSNFFDTVMFIRQRQQQKQAGFDIFGRAPDFKLMRRKS